MKYLVWIKGSKMVVKTEGIKEAREEAFVSIAESRKPVYIGVQNNNRLTDVLNDHDQSYCVKFKGAGNGRIVVGMVDRRGFVGYLDRKGNVVRKPIAYTKREMLQKYCG